MKNDLMRVWLEIKRAYTSILGIKDGTDFEATTEGVKRDISFKGHTAWILMFSIMIASIGLNVNSIPVIIGAMLISPLMGPIVGLGFSMGTHDSHMLIRSLKNLAIAVIISLLTSTLYFLLTPLNIEQTEILARTRPTILDVLIALFGGFAGIVAGSRKEKSNVIPGVAIATALMPPLCTAGYGLATLKLSYFFGAFYLFFINSVFITLATFLVVRYLRFPVVAIIDKKKFKRYRMIILTVVLITVIPSGVIFYGVVQETRFNVAAEKFISDNAAFDGSQLVNKKVSYSDTLSYIDLYFIGQPIPEDKQIYLQDLLRHYGLISESRFAPTRKTVLRIYQESGAGFDFEKRMNDYSDEMTIKILEELYTKNEKIIEDKDLKIQLLEKELLQLNKRDTMPYKQLFNELVYHFEPVDGFSYSTGVELRSVEDSLIFDTIPTFLIHYRDNYSAYRKKRMQPKIQEWLRVRLSNDKVRAVEYE